jgi:hypothetical protein
MFSMPRRGRFSMKGEKSLEGWSGRSTAGNREDRCSKVVRLPQWALLKVGDGVAEEGNRRRRWAGGGGGAEENGSFNQRESGGSKDGERWDAWKVPICLTKDSFRLRETNASQGNFFYHAVDMKPHATWLQLKGMCGGWGGILSPMRRNMGMQYLLGWGSALFSYW